MKNRLKGMLSDKEEGILHKEIIDTFFKKSTQDKLKKKKPKKSKKTSIFITCVLLLTLALSSIIIILYKKRPLAYNGEINLNRFHYAESIIKNGQINRSNIEEVYFDGDAKTKSSFLKNSIKLVNFGEHGRATLVIKFREPLDLNGKNILILAKAERGTKRVNLILKDDQSRFHEFSSLDFFSNWNLKQVYLDKKSDFDLKKVKELKIEFGSHTTGNERNSTIYLKGLTVRGVFK